MRAKVVESSDYDTQYGTLIVENVSVDEVQQKIYEIKNRFYDEGFNDWCIEDVFENFPKWWVWDYTQDTDDVVEI